MVYTDTTPNGGITWKERDIILIQWPTLTAVKLPRIKFEIVYFEQKVSLSPRGYSVQGMSFTVCTEVNIEIAVF